MSNSKIPLNVRRIAGLTFAAAMLIGVIISYKIPWERAAVAGLIMWGAGMADFAVMYRGIKKGLEEDPQQGLEIMREGMFTRLLLAAVATGVAVKFNFMPWAILIGLLIAHGVVLIDSIWSSIEKSRNS